MSQITAWTIVIVFLLALSSPLIYELIKYFKNKQRLRKLNSLIKEHRDFVEFAMGEKISENKTEISYKTYVSPTLTTKYVETTSLYDSEPEAKKENVFNYSKYIKTKHPYNHLITSKNKRFLNKLDYYLYWDRYEKLRQHAVEMLLNPTDAECILYKYLNVCKIDFIPQCICIAKGWYIMDCYLPKYHINIELDGGYHFIKEQQEKDWKRSQDIYKTYEIKTYRFTNYQILNGLFINKFNNLIK